MLLSHLSVGLVLALATAKTDGRPSHHDSALNAFRRAEIGLPSNSITLSRKKIAHRSKAGKRLILEQLQRTRAKYQQSFVNFLDNTGKTNRLQDPAFVFQAEPPTRRQDETSPLTDVDEGLLWVGQQGFGTPPQFFDQDYDTGSSDTFVNPGFYDPARSSTSWPTGHTFTVSYGDGSSATGQIYDDTLTIGSLQAFDQAVGSATHSTLGEDSAGIAGMAFPSIAQFNRDPFFYTLLKQGAISQAVFAFGLSEQNARLDLGGLDHSSYRGDIGWVPIDDSNGFWETSRGSLNGIPLASSIIDTGTTLVVGDPVSVAAICTEAGGMVIPEGGDVFCAYATGEKVPTFTFKFGDSQYTLSEDAVNFAEEGPLTLTGIVGSSVGLLNGFILGDVFLRDLYAAFDVENKRVGFAPRA